MRIKIKLDETTHMCILSLIEKLARNNKRHYAKCAQKLELLMKLENFWLAMLLKIS